MNYAHNVTKRFFHFKSARVKLYFLYVLHDMRFLTCLVTNVEPKTLAYFSRISLGCTPVLGMEPNFCAKVIHLSGFWLYGQS